MKENKMIEEQNKKGAYKLVVVFRHRRKWTLCNVGK